MRHNYTALFLISFALIFSCNDSPDRLAGKDVENFDVAEAIFIDEFDTKTLDTNSWNFDIGNGCPDLCGWGNEEKQYYTKDNISIKDGKLIITANKKDGKYYSTKLTTKDKIEFKYGTVEVKAKLPVGKGIWPAIWMLGADISEIGWPKCGELDIMEYVGWTKESISFYIDDELTYTFSPEVKNESTWPFNKPFYMIINLAVGGHFGGHDVDDSIFPQEFIIDYVKIYNN